MACRAPRPTWIGNGIGHECDLCGEQFEAPQQEVDIEDEMGASYIFHRPCHALWNSERLRSG